MADRTGLGVLTGEPTDPGDNAGPVDHAGHAGAVSAHRSRTGPVRGALGPGVVLLYLSVMVVLPI
ncbi:MAG TPA: hypothetical protein VIS06_10130, partial [Mycobacteriales bacterium]